MQNPDVSDDLLTIGRFARLSGLSVGALRHYDDLDVLRPAAIDPVWDEVRSITDVAGAVLDWLDRKRTAS